MTAARAWRCALCGWLNAQMGRKCQSCGKSKPRPKKSAPPPSFRPWRCVVLSLDVGDRSGWAVHSLGKLVESGEFEIYSEAGVAEVLRVVGTAKAHALQLGVPWVAMCERPWGGSMGTSAPASYGYWLFAMRNAQLLLSSVGKVYPNTWRARMLPRGTVGSARDIIRAAELQTASAYVKGRPGIVGNDQAPALLIGKWATQAGETAELLPKNARVTV